MQKTGSLRPYPDFMDIEKTYLNNKQMASAFLRYNNISYRQISQLLNISCTATIQRVVILTAYSITWVPNRQGGSYLLISHLLIKMLSDEIKTKRKGLNCMKTFEVRDFIMDELHNIYNMGTKRMNDWHALGLMDKFTEMYYNFTLTDSILSNICKKANIFNSFCIIHYVKT